MLIEYWKKCINSVFSSHKDCNESCPRINISDLLLLSLKSIYSSIKTSVLLVCCYAAIITALSFIFNNSIICNLPIANKQNILKCAPQFGAVTIAFVVLKVFIISIFIRVWYDYAINKQKLRIFTIFRPTIKDIKIFLILMVALAINLLPFGSYLLIQTRVPNPDWIIESAYFAFVSLGFIVPLLLVFYYTLIVFVIKKQKLPAFNTVNKYIFSNGNKIFFSTLLFMFLSVFFVTYYQIKTIQYISHNVLINTICSEFIYDSIILVFAMFFISYLTQIKQSLFDTNKDQLQ